MDHFSRAIFEGDERNVMMADLTQVKTLFSFSLGSIFKESVKADGKLNYN